MAEESLEEMAAKLSRSLPKFVELDDFERISVRIVQRRCHQNVAYQSKGKHSKGKTLTFMGITGERCILRPCKRQKGTETTLSPGVFSENIRTLEEGTGIPYKYLEIYIKGSGNSYKQFVKKLEEKYGI